MKAGSRIVVIWLVAIVVALFWGMPLHRAFASSLMTSWSRRIGARDYAEAHALHYNNQYIHYNEDCTNFMSIALHEGGLYSMQYQTPKWYALGVWHTFSWTVTGDFVAFINAKGWGYGGYSNIAPGTYNSAWYGDVILYDWNSDGVWDHASMEVVYSGCDPNSGWCGDLVDAHSRDRWHAFWTLAPYNASWQTTSYGLLHINY